MGRARVLLAFLVGLASLLVLLWFLLDDDARFGCTATLPERHDRTAVASSPIDDAVERDRLARAPATTARNEQGAAATDTGPPARIQGRVLDARTREAVPRVDVALSCGNVQRKVTTDVGGWFEIVAEFPRGTLSARVLDGESLVGSASTGLDPMAGIKDWTVSVPIGPTIPIASIDSRAAVVEQVQTSSDSKRADHVARWQVRIVESSLDPELAGELSASVRGIEVVQPNGELPDREWAWLDIRAGAPPFVRYAQQAHQPDERYRVRVEVRRQRDIGAPGSTQRAAYREIPCSSGIQPAVALVTQTAQVVKGRIVSRAKQPFARPPILVFASGLGRSSENRSTPAEAVVIVAQSKGSFESPPLPFDQVDLVVFAQGHEVKTVAVDRLPADPRGIEIELDPCAASLASILPSVPVDKQSLFGLQLFAARDECLRELGPTFVLQSGRDDPPSLDWAGLPAGDYTLEPIGMWLQAPWRGVLEATRLPRPELGALRVTELRAEPFRFRAVNMTERGLVKKFSVVFGPTGSLWRTEENAWSVDFALDDRARLAWTVWADGYAPAHGTEADFAPEDGARVATARLQRGFGAELAFRHRPFGKGGSALRSGPGGNLKLPMGLEELGQGLREWSNSVAVSNVRVLGRSEKELDITSGTDGVVHLASPLPPPVLRVQRAGWRVESVERQGDIGYRYVVWMRPR